MESLWVRFDQFATYTQKNIIIPESMDNPSH